MDFAEYGEVLKWDTKKCVFHPYIPKRDHLTENEIKKVSIQLDLFNSLDCASLY